MVAQGCGFEKMGHHLIKLADWNVRGSEVIGEMWGCSRCGLVMETDRRGILLIAPGGLGVMHKRIFPCQRPPACKPHAKEAESMLEDFVNHLAIKHDPRFHIAQFSAAHS